MAGSVLCILLVGMYYICVMEHQLTRLHRQVAYHDSKKHRSTNHRIFILQKSSSFLGHRTIQNDDDDAAEQHHNTDDATKATHSSETADDKAQVSNPTYYGWTPDAYPNPRLDPIRCKIASLNNTNTNNKTHNVLRLCDPDNVLEPESIQHVANELYNFTAVFSSAQQQLQPPWDNAGGQQQQTIPSSSTFVQLAVATVQKMNLPAVLRQGSYFAYEDEDDMVNDAAQIFARSLHDAWFGNDNTNNNKNNAVLIFMSVQDRACYITAGTGVSQILPWWRLDHVVGASIRPELRRGDYGTALVKAIHDLAHMLQVGPPTVSDRCHDFVARFGVVIAFAIFTFFFGAWGEYRDRRKRWHYAEQRSKLSGVEIDKARQLQKVYRTKMCPICLEMFDYGDTDACFQEKEQGGYDYETVDGMLLAGFRSSSKSLRRVDSYGIPLKGFDGRKLKLLRCGHIFCETCWRKWVHSGCGNSCNCPVCRQDCGKNLRKRSSVSSVSYNGSSDYALENSQSSNVPPASPSATGSSQSHRQAEQATSTLTDRVWVNDESAPLLQGPTNQSTCEQ
jgi:hypothetical protein